MGRDETKLPGWLLACVALAIATAAGLLLLYLSNFWGPLSDSQEIWGQFGDFLGGILNPLFSIVGLMALLYTIRLQSREMANSTRELERSADALKRQGEHNEQQKFDSRLFQLVTLHSQTLSSISIFEQILSARSFFEPNAEKPIEHTGSRAIGFLLIQLLDNYFHSVARGDSVDVTKGLEVKYAEWRAEYWPAVSKYYASLQNLITFISSRQSNNDEVFPVELLRSQLDVAEARLLVWVCCLEEGMGEILNFLFRNRIGFEHYEKDGLSRELGNLVSIRLFGSPIANNDMS